MRLSQQNIQLINDLGFSEELLLLIKDETKGLIKKQTFNHDKINGLSFAISEYSAKNVIHKLRGNLLAKGYLIFISETKYAFEKSAIEKEYDVKFGENDIVNIVSLIKANDPYFILEIMETNAPNFDLETNMIIQKLKEWEKFCSFEIRGAANDWIILDFKILPENMESFADEVYEFCPDTLDQGFHGEILEDFDEDSFEEAFDNQTTKDLANSIQKHKEIFLWWD